MSENAEWIENQISDSDGKDVIVVYCKKEKAKKVYPKHLTVNADREMLLKFSEKFGKDNVKLVEKSIENI